MSGSSLEICWYVPAEVRSALHVTIPITPFSIETDRDQDATSLKVQHMEPYSLLTDLLLVARALDGKWLEYDGKSSMDGGRGSGDNVRSINPLPVDGSIPVPVPNGTPSKGLLEYLLGVIPRSMPFLRFAIRVLRLADILYFESDTQEESRISKGNRVMIARSSLKTATSLPINQGHVLYSNIGARMMQVAQLYTHYQMLPGFCLAQIVPKLRTNSLSTGCIESLMTNCLICRMKDYVYAVELT